MTTLNIEQFDDLLLYLRQEGRLPAGTAPRFTRLPGGVSNRTVRVERADGMAFVIKQALEKLRVETEWRSDPGRSHREALGLQWLARLAPPGTIPPMLFEDPAHHLVAMQAVPFPHENWKSRLLAGRVDPALVGKFGELLAAVHRRAREFQPELPLVFDDRTFFESLRLEPYYSFTASRHPSAERFYAELISETRATRETLVHGDFSPKNVLIHRGALVLLDHEVVHWGDPAFDLGFSLTHFLSKANHLLSLRADLLDAALLYWQTYRRTSGEIASAKNFELGVVRHTLGCLLARVDGKSPLEYLSSSERDRQRRIVLLLLARQPASVRNLVEQFGRELEQD